jgi:hypothetical protein
VQHYTSSSVRKVVGNLPGIYFVKAFFSSSAAFLMTSVAPHKHSTFNADFTRGTGKNQLEGRSGEYGGCSSAVTLFFAKESLTKNGRCAGALSCRGSELLAVHFVEASF